MGDGLTQGGSGGDGAGGAAGTAGASSGSGGSGGMPVAGSATGGGGMASAGSAAGGMGGGGMAGATMGGGGMGGAGGAGGGGKGGMGGTSAGTGGGGAGGGPTGHRYVRFVAKSELAGKQWSACAEFGLFTTGGAVIPRTGWNITADSEETDDQDAPASNAIDGDNSTFWHTEWEPAPDDVNDAKLPHQLVIDLGSARPITGFSYTPRQSGTNGHIEDWEIYLSTTNGNWGTAVDSGSFPAGTATQSITF